MATKKPKGERFKRLRVPDAMPKPPENGDFPWRSDLPGLKGTTPAQQAMFLVTTEAWAKIMRPILEALDQQSVDSCGSTREYKAEQLEAVFLYGRANGLSSPEAIRDLLGSDVDPDVQATLCLPETVRSPQKSKRKPGLPSARTLYRHRQRLSHKRCSELLRLIFEELRDEALKRPEVIEASRILHLDGTALPTHYKAPKYRRRRKGETGPPKLMNPPRYDKKGKRIGGYTAPEAGNRGGDKATGHDPGDGWQLIPLTAMGLPLEYVIEKIHEGEAPKATAMFKKFAAETRPKLDWGEGRIGVCTADSNFNHVPLKEALHEAGYLSNIQASSHKDSDTTRARAETTRQRRIAIYDDHNRVKKWYADGHRQLHCECGQGHTFRRAEADSKGRAVARVEGYCKNCGSITVTAGRWHKGRNPSKKLTQATSWLMPMTKDERRLAADLRAKGSDTDGPDWQFGNFLTYDDPLAGAYGEDRFGHQEGFFGTINSRFGVGREKSWHRATPAQELEIAQAFCLIYALSFAHWKHMDQQNQQQPANVIALRPDPPPIDQSRAA